jgi:hypothetical protein
MNHHNKKRKSEHLSSVVAATRPSKYDKPLPEFRPLAEWNPTIRDDYVQFEGDETDFKIFSPQEALFIYNKDGILHKKFTLDTTFFTLHKTPLDDGNFNFCFAFDLERRRFHCFVNSRCRPWRKYLICFFNPIINGREILSKNFLPNVIDEHDTNIRVVDHDTNDIEIKFCPILPLKYNRLISHKRNHLFLVLKRAGVPWDVSNLIFSFINNERQYIFI